MLKWVISSELLDQRRGMLERTNTILEMLDSLEDTGDPARVGG